MTVLDTSPNRYRYVPDGCNKEEEISAAGSKKVTDTDVIAVVNSDTNFVISTSERVAIEDVKEDGLLMRVSSRVVILLLASRAA